MTEHLDAPVSREIVESAPRRKAVSLLNRYAQAVAEIIARKSEKRGRSFGVDILAMEDILISRNLTCSKRARLQFHRESREQSVSDRRQEGEAFAKPRNDREFRP